jgi:hypothetical protein
MKARWYICMFTASFLLCAHLSAAQRIMPVAEVQAGMDAWGLSVFRGDSIERFDVKIVGTLKNFLPKKDIILAELQGDRLRHTGVIGGMSGSPIYVGDRLIGALAYGWQFSKDPIFGITPIEQMLEIEGTVRAGDGGAAAPQSGAAAGPAAKSPARETAACTSSTTRAAWPPPPTRRRPSKSRREDPWRPASGSRDSTSPKRGNPLRAT